MKLGDLIAAQGPMERLIRQEVSAKIAFRLARIVRQANPILQDYEKARMGLLERLGTISEDGTQYLVKPKNQDEFGSEMESLLEVEVNMVMEVFGEEDLPNLTTADALALWWLISTDVKEANNVAEHTV